MIDMKTCSLCYNDVPNNNMLCKACKRFVGVVVTSVMIMTIISGYALTVM